MNAASSNKELAKAIYQAMINACRCEWQRELLDD